MRAFPTRIYESLVYIWKFSL